MGDTNTNAINENRELQSLRSVIDSVFDNCENRKKIRLQLDLVLKHKGSQRAAGEVH